jgi:peptide/nickel transport system substrate-binding protein
MVQLERATDQEEATELIRELAWVSNQVMPRIPQRQYSAVHYYRVDNWAYPEADAPSMQPPAASYWPLRVGEMSAKTE